jgi:hypothetical protein
MKQRPPAPIAASATFDVEADHERRPGRDRAAVRGASHTAREGRPLAVYDDKGRSWDSGGRQPVPPRHQSSEQSVLSPPPVPSRGLDLGGVRSWGDLLDNLGRPSAREIHPERQHLDVGQWVPMAPTLPSQTTALRVDGLEVPRWLLWRKPDSTWCWTLTELDDGRTRLVTRVHAVYDWTRPATALLGVVLMEFGDFAMMRRMLLGIKERAESLRGNPPV